MITITRKARPTGHALNSLLRVAALVATSLAAAIGLGACGGGGGLAGNNQSTDAGTIEYPIAYIQRPAPDMPIPDDEQNDLQDPFAFNPGAKLLIRSRADSNAQEVNISDQLVAAGDEDLYDVKDLAVSPDGKTLVFAFHKPMLENADPIDQPSWDIYSYNFETGAIGPVIPNKNKSEGDDVAPHFLADGRIVFVSDRQQKTRQQLADSGSPAYSGLTEAGNIKAGVLHIMNADGTGIDQISFNQSHDLSPSQLRDGQLVFTRWDNMNGTDRMDLYTINPSGMNLSYLYGFNSHDTGNDPTVPVQFSQPREMEDGRLITILRPYRAASMGGDLVAIDTAHFSDDTQATWENPSLSGPAQTSLAPNAVHIDGTLSPGGEFGAVWPLFDGTGRLLISWSQCRYLDSDDVIRACKSSTPADADPAPLLYGIWIFDPNTQTQKPIVTPREGVIYTDIVAASPAKTIATAADNVAGNGSNDLLDYGNTVLTTLENNDTAVLDIRSVYNFDGSIGNYGAPATSTLIADQTNPANSAYQSRRARFLQIVQGVPLPDPDDEIDAGDNQILRVPTFAFGQGRYLRQIVGYAPIEADGSVAVQVPADVPITFNILDANAQNIGTKHNVWWQFRVGEVVRCAGCHSDIDPASLLTHGRFDSSVPEINPGTTASGFFAGVGAGSVNFAGTRAGQTMAEVYAANKQAPRLPSLNVYFEDEWASDAGQKNPTLDYRYITADAAHPQRVPVTPVTSESCLENPLTPLESRWKTSCRIVINYLEHVQPIWDKSRLVDADGNALTDDMRCTSCHATTDAMSAAQVPGGQLDLTSGTSDRDNNRVMSYSELFSGDTVKDIAGNPVQQLDTNSQPVFDADGNPVYETIGHVMSAGSALGSSRFFGCFDNNPQTTCGFTDTASVRHANLLTKGELRLLSEWLDNGAQYYNDVSKAAAAQ